MNRVEVVVSHWRRPDNIPEILSALRSQTIPVTCTLIDSHEEPEYAVIDPVFDRVFRMPNLGAWTRFALCGVYEHEYTLFLDDDVIPGPKTVEALIYEADKLNNQFSVIGFHGRNFNGEMSFRDKAQKSCRVMWVVETYFVKTRNIHFAVKQLHQAGLKIELPTNHSDVILCTGIYYNTGYPCYIVPEPKGMKWEVGSQNHSVSKEDGYDSSLIETLRAIQEHRHQMF